MRIKNWILGPWKNLHTWYTYTTSQNRLENANNYTSDNGYQGRFEVCPIIHESTANADDCSRLSFGVPGRLPRVVPDSGASFNSYALPAGVSTFTVSVTKHR